MGRFAILTFVLSVGWLGFASSTGAATRSFRYQLSKKCGLDEYAGDVLDAPNVGRRFDVEVDDQGRRVKVSGFQDGVETSENRFQYSGDNKAPDGWAVVVHGKTNGVVKVTYGTNGCPKRMDFFTSDKELSAYNTFEQGTNRVLVQKYDSHDTLHSRDLLIYNHYDILVRKLTGDWRGKKKFMETTYDEASGMETSKKEFVGKELQARSECLYNAYGNLIARKNYDKAGRNFSGADYSAGMMTNQWYAQKGDHTLSFRYSYDENRWTKETKVYQDGRLVCVLSYDRMSNGVPKRTLAKSPEGELWGEYADEEVLVIRQDGSVGHTAKSKVYRTGRWW